MGEEKKAPSLRRYTGVAPVRSVRAIREPLHPYKYEPLIEDFKRTDEYMRPVQWPRAVREMTPPPIQEFLKCRPPLVVGNAHHLWDRVTVLPLLATGLGVKKLASIHPVWDERELRQRAAKELLQLRRNPQFLAWEHKIDLRYVPYSQSDVLTFVEKLVLREIARVFGPMVLSSSTFRKVFDLDIDAQHRYPTLETFHDHQRYRVTGAEERGKQLAGLGGGDRPEGQGEAP